MKGEQNHVCHSIVSALPNFTALYFNDKHLGNWEFLRFTEDSKISGPPMEKKGTIEIPFVNSKKAVLPSGYIDEPYWTDPKGRVINTVDGELFADRVLLYDTTDHVFTPRVA